MDDAGTDRIDSMSMISASSPGKKLPPPYVSYRTFWNFLQGLQQTIPARIDRSYWGERFSGSSGSQLMAALRFLGLTDIKGFPTLKLRQLVGSRGNERAEVIKIIARESYDFLAQEALDPQAATYAQLEEAFRDHFQLASDVVRKAIKFYVSLAASGGIKLSPFITGKTRDGHTGTSLKKSSVKSMEKKSRTEIRTQESKNGNGNPLDKLLIDKFPSLDPDWPDELKAKWFTAFNELLKRTSTG
jgi:hypothetical protein